MPSSNYESPANPAILVGPRSRATVVDKKAAFVWNLYDTAKKFKEENVSKNWKRWEEFYFGIQWPTYRPKWRSSVVANYIFSTIETIVPIMTDSRPKVVVMSTNMDGQTMAGKAEKIIDAIQDFNDWDMRLQDAVRNSMIYGTGFLKTYWAPWARNGKGEVMISSVSPYNLFPDPAAVDIETCEWLIYAANVPIEHVARRFPDKVKKVDGGIYDADLALVDHKNKMSQNSSMQAGVSRYAAAPGGSKPQIDPEGTAAGRTPVDEAGRQVTLIECWVRDDDSSTGTRVITVVNNALMEDEEGPTREGRIPFVKVVDVQIPNWFWGMGEVQQVEGLQSDLNKRRAQLADILTLTGNPPVIADSNSGIDWKNWFNRPGAILWKSPGTDVHWMQAPTVPSGLLESIQLGRMDVDVVTGVHDVTQGRKPAGVTAATAIMELQDAAQGRMRLKIRNMENGVQRLGRCILDLVQDYYTTPRTVRTIGQSGKAEFFDINQPKFSPDGQLAGGDFIRLGDFDVRVKAGSSLPVNKALRFQQGLLLWDRGIIDDEELLKVGDWPDWEGVLNRKQQAMAQGVGFGKALPPMPGEAGGVPGGPPNPDQAPMDKPGAQMGREMRDTALEGQMGLPRNQHV